MERLDVDGNVGILVGEKVEEGEHGIEINGVRVDLGPTGKDFEIGVWQRLVGVLEASLRAKFFLFDK
jgi:hypothetical protein